MADPLSVASGIVAILTAAVQSSKLLFQTIQSVRGHPRAVRQLKDELGSLNGVLQSLKAFSASEPTILLPLELPLTQCAEACSEFQKLVVKCTRHSGETRTSLRDWAKLQYKDNDVIGFTTMLSSYKSTIAIALADANLRSSSVTLHVLNEYKEMIRNTKQDLEDHLGEINLRLSSLNQQNNIHPSRSPTDLERFQSERKATEQCLEICHGALTYIDQLKLQPPSATKPRESVLPYEISTRDLTLAHVMTLLTLKECTERLNDTLDRLRIHGAEVESRLSTRATAQQGDNIPPPTVETQRLANEHESVRQCLEICSEADKRATSKQAHILEDIVIGENGEQMLITTFGELFDARRIRLGDKATQVVASASDPAIQELFKARNRI